MNQDNLETIVAITSLNNERTPANAPAQVGGGWNVHVNIKSNVMIVVWEPVAGNVNFPAGNHGPVATLCYGCCFGGAWFQGRGGDGENCRRKWKGMGLRGRRGR